MRGRAETLSRETPRRGVSTVLLMLVVLAAGPLPAEEAPPPPVGVTVAEAAGAWRLEAVLPGRLVAATLPSGAAGRRWIALLVAPEDDPDGPRALFRLDLEGPGGQRALVPLARDLPAAADTLDAIDIDGDGAQEVLVGEPGRLWSFGAEGGAPARQVLADPSFDLGSLLPGRTTVPAADRREIAAATVGSLRRWAPDGAGGLALAAEHPLPVVAAREWSGLRLTSPAVATVPRAGAPPLYAVGPQPHGRDRLTTLLIDPQGGQVEAWSRLPGPESVDGRWLLLLGGRPVLAVATLDAEKVGVFAKKRLRLFALAADRTRAGAPPVLALETASRRWQEAAPVVVDADGDGRDDLVVIQPEGLAGKELLVESFLGRGDGRLEPRGRRTLLEVQADAWSYGGDVTGDGVPDLVATSEGRLLLFRGARGGAAVLERTPHRTLAPGIEPARGSTEISVGTGGTRVSTEEPDAGGAPRVVDLDGDGVGEILLVDPDQAGRGVVRVVRLVER